MAKRTFHDTIIKDRTIQQAMEERRKAKEKGGQRRCWFRRQEDEDRYLAEKRKARRDEIQKWVIISLLFFSLLVGDLKLFDVAKGLLGG